MIFEGGVPHGGALRRVSVVQGGRADVRAAVSGRAEGGTRGVHGGISAGRDRREAAGGAGRL